MQDHRKGARPSGPFNLFEETRNKAIAAVRCAILRDNLTQREVENIFSVDEATLRFFLEGKHKRRPRRATYEPLLSLLDEVEREAMLDFLDFRERVLKPKYRNSVRQIKRAELRVVKGADET
ncbi:MAG: hypothetical protein KDJ29_20600 [Hyphomicrobiales bacterium]|nr:hypothetical protein [Hyphomicrobiales bacterium]